MRLSSSATCIGREDLRTAWCQQKASIIVDEHPGMNGNSKHQTIVPVRRKYDL